MTVAPRAMSTALRHFLRVAAAQLLGRSSGSVEGRLAAKEQAPAVASDVGCDAAVAWGLKLYGSRLALELYALRLAPLTVAMPP
jgi:hypothetical protein